MSTPRETLHQPRNVSKAHLRFEQQDVRSVVVKDYRKRKSLFKLYGRLTLHNEARAYERLSGIPGIPACFGFRSLDVLAIEYIPAIPLSRQKPGSVPKVVFDRLDQLVAAMHERGVANADIHRSNVLVSENNEVYLVDFAHAVIAQNPRQPGMVTRWCMELDRYACARMRARYLHLPQPSPPGVFGVVYRVATRCKKALKRMKKIFLKGN